VAKFYTGNILIRLKTKPFPFRAVRLVRIHSNTK